jgi:hypothetical protein
MYARLAAMPPPCGTFSLPNDPPCHAEDDGFGNKHYESGGLAPEKLEAGRLRMDVVAIVKERVHE